MCLAAPAKKLEPKVEVKPQKKRVKKDKDAPKKPMPPFFCYQKGRRDNLKAENPTADNTQLIKVSDGLALVGDFPRGLWALLRRHKRRVCKIASLI